MTFDHAVRLEKIRKSFRSRSLDSILISGKENIYYLSGFTGADSWLLIAGNRSFLITDFRYREQAEAEVAPMCETRERSAGSLAAAVAGLCRELRLRRIGCEEHRLSCADFRRLQKELGGRELLPAGPRVENLRMIKDPEEIALLRQSGRRTARLLGRAAKAEAEGLTETALAARLSAGFLKQGGQAAFPPIVAGGSRSSRPHAAPSDFPLRAGMILLVDLGGRWEFYNADMTRTFVLGDFPRRFKSIYRAVLSAQKRALAAIRPGMRASLIDKSARDFLARKGYGSSFGHSLGHGVGLEVHEGPAISAASREVLAEGMVFTVEPGVYIPGWGGIRIEDTVLVTAAGCEILTDCPRDLGSCCLEARRGKSNQ
ncbi:MAG: Xaa-Pro peptidase family protein [PVC group bacterium]